METKTTTTGPAPKKRHGILKTVLWIFGVLVALVIALFFVATSAAFLKGMILPKVSKSLNADVTVTDASIHPFSSVLLKDLKVQSKGYEPLPHADATTWLLRTGWQRHGLISAYYVPGSAP